MGKIHITTIAYNAENTIGRTLDSVLGQTYSDFDWFIIDNGSTDNTNRLIRQRAERDARIRWIRLDKNDLGLASEYLQAFATKGAANAATEWGCTIDADDAYHPAYLSKLLHFAEDNQLDVAAGGYSIVDGDTGAILKTRKPEEDLLLSGDAFAEHFSLYRGFTVSLWGKLYKTSFIKEHADAIFIKNISETNYYMDSREVLRIFRCARRAGVLGESLYSYYRYKRSQSHILRAGYIENFRAYCKDLEDHIAAYGPVSQYNADYLQAVIFSILEEQYALAVHSAVPPTERIQYVRALFATPEAQRVLAHQDRSGFRNLTTRDRFEQDVAEWITIHEKRDDL